MSVFVEEQRGRFGVEPICEALGVSASAYYRRATGERSARAVEDDRLLELIRHVHERNYYCYGSWRMWRALGRADEQVGRGRVERLMRAHGIQGAKRRGKPWRTTIPDGTATRPADLVQRDFTASGPNELWVSDFTYLRCWEGPVFFAFVIDVYSRDEHAGSSRRRRVRTTPRGLVPFDAACIARRLAARSGHDEQTALEGLTRWAASVGGELDEGALLWLPADQFGGTP